MVEQQGRSRLGQVLADVGLPIDESDFTDALASLLGAAGRRSEAPMTEGERVYLRGDPNLDRASDEEVSTAVAGGAARVAELAAMSLSAAQVAERAGVEASTVRHWVSDGDVLAFGGRRRRFVPTQFAPDGGPLPGLRLVLRALPPAWHPYSLHRWLTLPSRDLEREGERVSPRQWLLEGGPVEPVVAAARAVEGEARTDPREATVVHGQPAPVGR